MEFNDVLEKRHSVRSFKSKGVSWESAIEAIDSALKAPFADNRCHLKFIIIEEQKTIEKIASIAEQSWMKEAGIVIVVCSDDSNLENMHGERGRIYSRQQSGAAIQNLLLRITDLGLGACWIGSYSDKSLRQLLKIPSKIQIEAIIPIGYESTKVKTKKSKEPSLEHHLFWECWDKNKRPTLIGEGSDPDPSSFI